MKKLFKKKSFVEKHVYRIRRDREYGRYHVEFRKNWSPFWRGMNVLNKSLRVKYLEMVAIDTNSFASIEDAKKYIKVFLQNISKLESGSKAPLLKSGTIETGSLEEYVVTELI